MRRIQAAFVLCSFFGTALAQIRVRSFLDLPGETGDPSISPDGKTLAFQWLPPDMNRWGLYTGPMSGGEPQLFAKGDGLAVSPKWSPDGQWIAFLRWQTPRTVSVFIEPAAGGEERLVGAACNREVAWTADSRSLITPNNGRTDSPDECRLVVTSIEPGGPTWQLAQRGTYPALSPDGKTLAFVRDREIHLLALTRDGHAVGVETTLVREPLTIIHPAWIPGTNELVYLLLEDRSVVRRIEARQGAKPADAGSVDGEFDILSPAPDGGSVLGEVRSHDDSYWRIDLRSPDPHFEQLRRLPWNARSLRLAPDGQKVLSTVSARGASQLYTSSLDGSDARRLFSTSYQVIEQAAWSPDGKQIAFTAEPWVSQVSPSYLLIASINGGSSRRLLPQFDYVYGAAWSRDGNALYFVAQTKDGSPIWKLDLSSNKLTQITELPGQQVEGVDEKYLYVWRIPFSLLRIPLTGGPEEPVVGDALSFVIGQNELYFVRQDAKPPTLQGLNLYRLNLATRATQFVANVGFGAASLQLSPDGRFIYAERHDPPSSRIMLVQGLR